MSKNMFYRRETKQQEPDNNYSNLKELDILDELISGSYKKKKHKKDKGKKSKKKDKKKSKEKDKKKKKPKMLDLKDVVDVDKEKVEKENEDFYEYRFNSSLVLLRELLKQTNGELIDGKNILEEFKRARGARGSFTAITNQSSNITSLIGTKLNIIKEITNVNKSISDLENKRLDRIAKANANSKGLNGEGVSDEQILDSILNKVAEIDNSVYNGGKDPDSKKDKKKKSKKSKSKDLEELDDLIDVDDDDDYDNMKSFDNDDDADDDFYNDDDEDKKEKSVTLDVEIDDNIDDDDIDALLDKRLKKLEKKGLIEYSDNERAFKYEKSNIEIVVIKSSPDSTVWRFAAIDPEGDEVEDYPLPPKRSTKGKMKFNYEKGIAKDKLDNSYRIVYDASPVTNEDFY